ncbi:MAG: phosphoglycerate mutase [Anaerolinea sp.]|nr:phosphoglycerate mutase [Anaerolinea sp.]
MEFMTTIMLIRHGENDSIGRYLPGQRPGLHLNVAGQEQARQIGLSLADVPVSRVISSPMERAMETAVPLAEARNLRIEIHPGFTEMHPGDWTGRSFSDLNNDPAWAKLRSDPDTCGYPGGEDFKETQQRLWTALQEVLDQEAIEKGITAIFSHADCIRLLLAKALEIPLKRYNRLMIATASLSILVFRKNLIILDGQNLRLPCKWQPRK